MLQSIHAILHNILFLELHFYEGTVQYSILHIILILQCSYEQIYFQAFLFSEFYIQLASSFHMKCTVCRNNILLGELQIFNRCSQTTVSLHAPRLPAVYTPSSLQLNPQETFFLENMHILQEETRTRILPEEVLML